MMYNPNNFGPGRGFFFGNAFQALSSGLPRPRRSVSNRPHLHRKERKEHLISPGRNSANSDRDAQRATPTPLLIHVVLVLIFVCH